MCRWETLDETNWVEKIWINYPGFLRNKITDIKVRIGNKEFEIESREILENSILIKKSKIGDFEYLYNLPENIKLSNHLLPFLRYINIDNYGYLIYTGLLESLAIIILLLSIILNFNKEGVWRIERREDKKWIFIFIIFSITFLITSFYAVIGIDFFHDGVSFNPAFDVVSGKLLFRDTCCNKYGALSIYLQALAMLIFGKYLIVTKILTTFFYGLIAVILYIIWKRILSEKLALLACIISVLILPYYYVTEWLVLAWSSVYALFFSVNSLILYYKIL